MHPRILLCSLLLCPALSPAEPEKEKAKPSTESADSTAPEMPEAPLKIDPPAEPPSQIEKVNLKTATAEELVEYLGQAMAAENTDDACAFLYWFQRRFPRGGEMQMLARLSAMRKKADDSFYWLQRAAREDRIDFDELTADEAFAAVRKDKRYEKLQKFGTAVKEAWQKSGYRREVVTVPKGYKAGTPVPVFVAFHGLGSQPEDFGRAGDPQDLADELNAAVVSISATEPWGKNSFVWKENFEADWAHVQKALERVKDKVTPQPGKCIAAGFSQGGQLAAELAAAHPEFFAGAIVLSPGYSGKRRLGEAIKAGGDKTASQLYFVTWMSGENKSTVAAAKDTEKILNAGKARVISHAFSGNNHEFPPDHEDHFAIWAKLILANKP